eukprot:Hpha_TRINITY_DN9536_c0_g1::TRINITY_DN9536_c0_g1_i1::g.114862::m.114862
MREGGNRVVVVVRVVVILLSRSLDGGGPRRGGALRGDAVVNVCQLSKGQTPSLGEKLLGGGERLSGDDGVCERLEDRTKVLRVLTAAHGVLHQHDLEVVRTPPVDEGEETKGTRAGLDVLSRAVLRQRRRSTSRVPSTVTKTIEPVSHSVVTEPPVAARCHGGGRPVALRLLQHLTVQERVREHAAEELFEVAAGGGDASGKLGVEEGGLAPGGAVGLEGVVEVLLEQRLGGETGGRHRHGAGKLQVAAQVGEGCAGGHELLHAFAGVQLLGTFEVVRAGVGGTLHLTIGDEARLEGEEVTKGHVGPGVGGVFAPPLQVLVDLVVEAELALRHQPRDGHRRRPLGQARPGEPRVHVDGPQRLGEEGALRGACVDGEVNVPPGALPHLQHPPHALPALEPTRLSLDLGKLRQRDTTTSAQQVITPHAGRIGGGGVARGAPLEDIVHEGCGDLPQELTARVHNLDLHTGGAVGDHPLRPRRVAEQGVTPPLGEDLEGEVAVEPKRLPRVQPCLQPIPHPTRGGREHHCGHCRRHILSLPHPL